MSLCTQNHMTSKINEVEFIKVTVFEGSQKLGGVWAGNYAGFGLQTPCRLYEFPDFPFPGKTGAEFPKVFFFSATEGE